MRFGKDSWVYDVFREWIRQGAKRTPGSGEIATMTVTPAGLRGASRTASRSR